ncbi:YhgE/Pip domain-containing protein [Microbacteriaceae bacterium VKM Ac-2855]|nr:YhgE/Pip domain-containing protein [Microbacteriaceae bacterium VKM Ac-2855]
MALFSLERPRGTKKVTWFTILGIILVPLAIGGLLVWALWNPTERLDNVKAAVVNLDTPIELNGQTVPLGRQLAAGLVTGGSDTSTATPTPTPTASTVANVSGSDSSGNFTWVLTDADDAAAGLASGEYATVVTIPSNFSAAATSYSGDAADAVHATIDIATSEKSKLVDGAISATVTSTATGLLNSQLTTAYLENVYVGFNTLHDQLGTAADGAGTLADGATELGSGAGTIADGTGTLATGIDTLADGAGELSSGVGELSTGAGSLAAGIGQVSTGADGLADGVGQLATGTQQSADGAATLAGGAGTLATGLDALAGGVGQIADGAKANAAYSGGAATLTQSMAAELGALLQECATTPAANCATITQLATQMGITTPTPAEDSLLYLTGAASAAATGVSDGLNVPAAEGTPSLRDGLTQSASGAHSLADGATALASGLGQLATGASSAASGATQLASGAAAVATGASQLATGASSAADGASKLADGATSAADGAAALATGTRSLADGATQLGTGATQLSDGLDTAVTSLPSYTDAERENLAGVVADPVSNDSASVSLFGAGSTPFFSSVALWLGALATFLVIGAFPARALTSTRSSFGLAVDSYLPALLIGVVQGIAVSIVMAFVAGMDLGTWIGFTLMAMLAGAAFASVNQGLVALLGGIGRFISMIIVVFSLGAGIISTAPTVFDDVLDFVPLSTALDGMQAIVNGTDGAAGAAFVLVLWALFGLVLTVIAIARRRTLTVAQLSRLGATA